MYAKQESKKKQAVVCVPIVEGNGGWYWNQSSPLCDVLLQRGEG